MKAAPLFHRLIILLALLGGCNAAPPRTTGPVQPAHLDAPSAPVADTPATSAARTEIPPSPPPETRSGLFPLTIHIPGGAKVRFQVELAITEDQQRTGLMHRKSLPENQGMLFIYDYDDIQTFWMKNTLIPLDMVFIGRDRKVAGVIANAEPLTETSRSINAPSRYVLEINGGHAEKLGVTAGSLVDMKDIPGVAP
ncbi:MAG: hypothetical protein GMKNLPBB_00347 [Myxococcota bacterium]|nr:hypothetical protein [Myxococcota bacterium]